MNYLGKDKQALDYILGWWDKWDEIGIRCDHLDFENLSPDEDLPTFTKLQQAAVHAAPLERNYAYGQNWRDAFYVMEKSLSIG